jgi:hypothetical protein
MHDEVDPNASDVPPETDGDVDDDELDMDELENDSEDEDLAGEARLRRRDLWGNYDEDEDDSVDELGDQLMGGEGGAMDMTPPDPRMAMGIIWAHPGPPRRKLNLVVIWEIYNILML